MSVQEVCSWIQLSRRRAAVMLAVRQPSTARQLARVTGFERSGCSRAIGTLLQRGLVSCLNSSAGASRLYWLTLQGMRCQRHLRESLGLSRNVYDFPVVDWDLYGDVCYRHREAIIKALTEPMQSASIKRRIVAKQPGARISAGNVRDIIAVFRQFGIVEPVQIRKRKHARYQLTALGQQFRTLLLRAEERA